MSLSVTLWERTVAARRGATAGNFGLEVAIRGTSATDPPTLSVG